VESLRKHTLTARGAGKKRIGRGMGHGKRRDGGAGITAIRSVKPVAGQTTPPDNHPSETQSPRKQEIAELKEAIGILERQVQDFERHIDRVLRGENSVIAHVDEEKCQGCGICVNICPTGALTVNDIAVIKAQRCTGCGACVTVCPFEAISLS